MTRVSCRACALPTSYRPHLTCRNAMTALFERLPSQSRHPDRDVGDSSLRCSTPATSSVGSGVFARRARRRGVIACRRPQLACLAVAIGLHPRFRSQLSVDQAGKCDRRERTPGATAIPPMSAGARYVAFPPTQGPVQDDHTTGVPTSRSDLLRGHHPASVTPRRGSGRWQPDPSISAMAVRGVLLIRVRPGVRVGKRPTTSR